MSLRRKLNRAKEKQELKLRKKNLFKKDTYYSVEEKDISLKEENPFRLPEEELDRRRRKNNTIGSVYMGGSSSLGSLGSF